VTSVHELGALVALAAAGLLLAGGAAAAWRDLGHEWVHRLAVLATGLYGVVAAVGLLLLLSGESPRDGLHLLYGVVLFGTVPAGLSFATEAPPRARSGVLAGVGAAALLVIWRLFSTG